MCITVTVFFSTTRLVEYDLLQICAYSARIQEPEMCKHASDGQYIGLYSMWISITEQVWFGSYDCAKMAQNDILSKSWKLTHFKGQLRSNKTRTQTLQACIW